MTETTHTQVTLPLEDRDEALLLFGSRDQHLRLIRDALGVRLIARGDKLQIEGDEDKVDQAERAFVQLREMLSKQGKLGTEDVRTVLSVVQRGADLSVPQNLTVVEGGRHVRPRTDGQARYVHAMRNNDVVLCIGPAGTGKCVAAETLVLTGEGMVPIEELGRGTPPLNYRAQRLQVCGVDGLTWTSHVYNGGVSDTVRIQTQHGFYLEGTPEHPLLVQTPEGYAEWRCLDELRPGDYVALARGQNLFGNETRIDFQYQPRAHDHSSRPVHLERLDPEFAYFMGLLVGDGCLVQEGRVIFSTADPQLRDAFRAIAARWQLRVFANGAGRPYDNIIASHQLYALLMHLGLSSNKAHEKRVPASILKAPREVVVAFLKGLFDTDGTVSRREGYPAWATASAKLADEVHLLLLNLGVVACRRLKKTVKRPSHILELRGSEADRFAQVVGFRLERKAALLRGGARNPNLDVVPHVAALIDPVVRLHTFSRKIHHNLYDYRIGRRTPGYAKLAEMLPLFSLDHPSLDQLYWLQDKHFLWSKITRTEAGRSQVYDLTVPGSHSFVAGGFVNHNTYLAVGMAVTLLRQQIVKRIVLVRPAVEAGERLGFLPGDLVAKINPYLRPLLDALHDMLEAEQVKRYMDTDIIEIAPLAFMRGRTLNHAAIILDEGQNTTVAQMKMFLTRMGQGSKIIVTGDVTQVDLPRQTRSGLNDAIHRLRDVERIAVVHLSEHDIVRHALVQQIVKAYEEDKPRKKKE